MHVGCWIGHGDEAILEAVERVRELAGRYSVREVIYDPWRMTQAAMELERDGLACVKFPQSDARMMPASQALHEAVVQGRLVVPDHAELAEHAANAVQRHSRRGWRIDTPARGVNVDAIVALAMAVERASWREPEAQLVGWL
jgi:phage terminase large subunit-like protein